MEIKEINIDELHEAYKYVRNEMMDESEDEIEIDNSEPAGELKNQGIVIKIPYEVEVTETVQEVYTVFAESESQAIDIVNDGLADEYSPLQSDNANLFTDVQIFTDELEDEIEIDM